jgi:hypothetical protein
MYAPDTLSKHTQTHQTHQPSTTDGWQPMNDRNYTTLLCGNQVKGSEFLCALKF